jgi:hypothetical protein
MEDWIKLQTDALVTYVNSFIVRSPSQSHNLIIKRDHSLRVAEHSRRLALHLKLNDEDVKVAVVAGIFHDIARFKQLKLYNTFNDLKSFDHADYAIPILKENEWLNGWSEEVLQIIYLAIRWHNKLDLPPDLTGRELLHARILRDADKLDIFKVLTDYYSDTDQPANHTLSWELPEAREVSPEVAEAVLSEKLVSKKLVRSDVDVKVMQLSWVYDLNFRYSAEVIRKNRFLEKIYNSLPENEGITEIYRKIMIFVENKLQ